MKPLKLFLVIVFFSNLNFAQWQQTKGPYVADIRCSAIFNDDLYIGTYGAGVYKSTDDGDNWNQVNNGLTEGYRFIYSMTVIGNNIYAGTAGGGVFISSDQGLSWHNVNQGITTSSEVVSLVVSGSNIFAGTREGAYHSSDNGTNWSKLTGLPLWDEVIMAASGTNIYAGAKYNGVYHSANNGQSWQFIGIYDMGIVGICAIDNAVIVSSSLGGTKRSTDNGVNWYPVDVYSEHYTINEGTVYAGTYGISKSTDQGLNWTYLGLTDTTVNSVSADGSKLYAGTPEGFLRSTDNGTTWSAASHGIINSYCIFLGNLDSDIFTIIFNDISQAFQAYLSSDFGESWIDGGAGLADLGSKNIREVVTFGGINFAATEYGIYRSEDRGNTWTVSGFSDTAINTILPVGEMLFAVVRWNGVYRSLDTGKTWTPAGLNSRIVQSLAVTGDYIYAAHLNHAGISVTTDFGVSWTRHMFADLESSLDVAAIGNKIFCLGEIHGLFLSTDYGSTWNEFNGSFSEFTVSDTTIYALNELGRLYKINYSDTIFTPVDPSFGETIGWTAIQGPYIFANVQYNGIWRIPRSGISSAEKIYEISAGYFLAQNFPNPFNPSTAIIFTIPSASKVSITVYDILGKQTAVLLNEERPAGTHKVTWNASNLASGVYFYQIITGDFIQTKEMILMK